MRPLRFSLNVTLVGCCDYTVGIADTDYGRFAWVYDSEGNNIELWDPK